MNHLSYILHKMSDARVLNEMFHDSVRLGHYIVYKVLARERDVLFQKIMEDYEMSPMDRYELERTILSDHYLQIQFPQNADDNYDSIHEHAKRKNKLTRMVS